MSINISQTQYGEKINNHERFSRKNNICILGMRFSPNENCISKATEYQSNLLQRDAKIERAYRDGRAPSGKDRQILVKCSIYQDKCNILKTAKASFRSSSGRNRYRQQKPHHGVARVSAERKILAAL